MLEKCNRRSVEFYSAVALSLITEFGSAEGGSHANHSLQTILETVVIDNIDPAVAAAVSGPSPGNGARLINVGKIQQLQAAASGRKTYHVELDLPKDWSYETGDHLGVYPTNHPELVKRACARLNLKPDQTVLVKVRDQSKKCQPTVPVNQLIRVDTLLTHWIDLKTVPSRANCELLATYATKADQKAKLCSFSASDGAAIYKTEISSHWCVQHVIRALIKITC
jgi:sulfite reductase alpha subunit-like flavoprotein